MSPEEMQIRQKIILAAIDCIEKDGLASVTTRSIAKQAGVNIAAVNYYFGSKEKLLEAAKRQTIDHFIGDAKDYLLNKDMSPEKRLKSFFHYFLDGGARYPNVTLAHLYDPLITRNYNTAFVKKFNQLLCTITDEFNAEMPGIDKKHLQMSIMTMFSALTLAALMPRFFKGFSNFDFSDSKDMKTYIKFILSKLWETKRT